MICLIYIVNGRLKLFDAMMSDGVAMLTINIPLTTPMITLGECSRTEVHHVIL